jgi:hypothetical protein
VLPGLLLLLAPAADDGYTYPPVRRGSAVARFTVEVPEGSGPPRVWYALTVEGGPGLEVEPPQLADAAGAWAVRRASAWSLAGGRATWTEEVELDQEKPGIVPLPDVKLRFRDGPSAAWEQVEWKDVLKDVREAPGPALPHPAKSAHPLRWAALAAAVAALLLAAAAALLRRRGAEAPLPPEGRALRELDRLAPAAGTPGYGPEWLYTQLADVVRRYLGDRYGLPALRQTTSEFLKAVREAPALAGEEEFLREFLEGCDLAKFAGVRPDPAEWGRAVDSARAFVRRTAPATGGDGSPSSASGAERAPL